MSTCTCLNCEKLTDLTIVTVHHVPAYLRETLLLSTMMIPPEGFGRSVRWCSLEETVVLEVQWLDFPRNVGFFIIQCNYCTPWCCIQRILPLMIMLETRSTQKCRRDSEHTPREPQDSNLIDDEQRENTTLSRHPRREVAVRAYD